MSNNPYGMTSREAAALYLSEGHTTDPDLASMLDAAKKQPELLIPRGSIPEATYKPAQLVIDDPDEAERKRLRGLIGFDYEVELEDKKAVITAKGTKLFTVARLSGDEEADAKRLSQAVLRLKAKYERRTHD